MHYKLHSPWRVGAQDVELGYRYRSTLAEGPMQRGEAVEVFQARQTAGLKMCGITVNGRTGETTVELRGPRQFNECECDAMHIIQL